MTGVLRNIWRSVCPDSKLGPSQRIPLLRSPTGRAARGQLVGMKHGSHRGSARGVSHVDAWLAASTAFPPSQAQNSLQSECQGTVIGRVAGYKLSGHCALLPRSPSGLKGLVHSSWEGRG